jgi:hypothetical protein
MTTTALPRGRERSRRAATWLAGGLWLTCALLLVLTVAAIVANPRAWIEAAEVVFVTLFVAVISSLATMGALLGTRRPENPIGWLLLVSATLMVASLAAGAYAQYAVGTGRAPTDVTWVAWGGNVLFQPGVVLAGLVIVVFPSGSLSSRGRPVVALVVLGAAVSMLSQMLAPGPVLDGLPIGNPTGIEGAEDALELLGALGSVLLLLGFAAATSSLLLRYRRARGDERKQIEWFAYVAFVITASLAVGTLELGLVSDLAWLVALAALAALPIAIGIAVTKYGLYRIDALVSRTLVYLPLIGLLGGAYALAVTLFQRFFLALTGETSDAANLLATLIVAAAFDPVHKSVEAVVERRLKRPAGEGAEGGDASPSGARAAIEEVLADPRFEARVEQIVARLQAPR